MSEDLSIGTMTSRNSVRPGSLNERVPDLIRSMAAMIDAIGRRSPRHCPSLVCDLGSTRLFGKRVKDLF